MEVGNNQEVLTVSENSENLDMKYHQQTAAIWKIMSQSGFDISWTLLTSQGNIYPSHTKRSLERVVCKSIGQIPTKLVYFDWYN